MTFPNVPVALGVPALLRDPAFVSAPLTLLTSDAAFPFDLFSTQWGIFQDGQPVVVAESVISMDYKQEYTLSNYPVEQGAFETYDKVQLPYEIRVRFASGGSLEERQSLLDSLDAIIGTTDLYDIYMPETIFTDVNITHRDFRRTSNNGVGMLIVDVYALQVRQTGEQTFTNTKTASGSSPTNNGTVQTTPATPTQTNTLPALNTGS